MCITPIEYAPSFVYNIRELKHEEELPLKIQVGIVANRNPYTGEFLPSRPLMSELDSRQVDRVTGLTDEDKRACDELAKKFCPIFKELMKKGTKRV